MMMDQILETLKVVFTGWPAALKSKQSESEYKRELMKAAATYRITTKEQIARGIKVAREEAGKGREFLPPAPMFMKWCLPMPEDIGIAPFEQALQLVNDRQWEMLHPAFQCIAAESYETEENLWPDYSDATRTVKGKSMKAWKKKWRLELFKDTGDNKHYRKHFREFYDEVVKRVSNGERFERIKAVQKQEEPPRTNPTGVKVFGRDRGTKVLKDLIAQSKTPGAIEGV